jgi:short subunit dehydrogenase-like uncharacterized protein
MAPGIPLRQTSVTFPGDTEATPVVKFPLQEPVTVPRHITVGRVDGVAEAALAAQFSAPLTAEAIQSLPEGPSADARKAQRFTIVLDATATDGRRLRGVVQGPDTCCSTAVIASEAAVRLSTSPAKPGVLAPAQAFDPAGFLAALAPHGITWTIEPG